MNTTFTSLFLLFYHRTITMKMKSIFYLLIFGTLISLNSVNAQSGNKKEVDKYFDESGGFKHRLWYGGGFNIGYQGGDIYNLFSVGITPMVGYKIIPSVSFGPRVGFDYTYIKGDVVVNNNGQPEFVGRKSANLTNYSVGIFGRVKFLKVLFVHVETNYESTQNVELIAVSTGGFIGQYLYGDITNGNKIRTTRDGRNNTLAGLGYNSGEGLFGYEISLLYNFNVPENSAELPWDFRIGFTYKF